MGVNPSKATPVPLVPKRKIKYPEIRSPATGQTIIPVTGAAAGSGSAGVSILEMKVISEREYDLYCSDATGSTFFVEKPSSLSGYVDQHTLIGGLTSGVFTTPPYTPGDVIFAAALGARFVDINTAGRVKALVYGPRG